jgi:hypothetical protein
MGKVTFHAFLAFRLYCSHTGSTYHLSQVGIDEISIDEVLDKGIKIVATPVLIVDSHFTRVVIARGFKG